MRAQSSVSLTLGAFLSSSWRMERTMRAIWSARLVAHLGHLGEHDLLLPLEVGIVDVQVQAAALQRLRQLTGVVRREEDERDLGGRHRSQLGNGHLVVGEDLQQQGLGLDFHAVDLVDEEHDRLLGPDGLEQRASEEELLAEDVVVDVDPSRRRLATVGLDAQELLLVVPLVERLGLVEALVALQADEASVAHLGHATWPAASCPCRRALRSGPASRGGPPGTPLRRCPRRRGT